MNIETMLYIYLFVCAGMIVFNIITAVVLKHSDKKTTRISKKLLYEVNVQIDNIENGKEPDRSHKKYLYKKLKHISNMIAFDKMLENEYIANPEVIREYLYHLDSVFIALTNNYCTGNIIEAAYFPYIIKKYRLIAYRPFPSIVGMLFDMLEKPSIYCRENVLQALYTTGDADCVIKAIKIIDRSTLFFHDKLLADGLLNFSGNLTELNNMLTEQFDSFSLKTKVALLNYLRFSTDKYKKFVFNLLCDDDNDSEIHYACIRYLGKYPFDKAYEKLCEFARESSDNDWEYAAISSSALSSYPGEKTVEILKNNLYSDNWYIRYNSAGSLKSLGLTYTNLADVIDGNDRYAAEILRYRLENDNCEERSHSVVC